MNNKNAMKKSLVLLCACTIFVLISATPIFGNAGTAEDPVTAYFAPDLTPGSNFTWKVNDFWGMSEWLIPSPYYDPQAGDLWELKIVKELPSLSLDGSISANISEWYEVDFDATLDIKDYFEFNIAGVDYFGAFGDESDPALNWRMLHQLFLLPYTVEDENGVIQNFADYYGASFDEDMNVDTTGGALKVQGTISDGVYQNNTIELNCSLGLREEFVYHKKQYDTGISIGLVNLTLIESEFGPPPPSIPVVYYIIGGGGVLLLGVATVLLVRRAKVRKPTSQTAPGPHDLGSKTRPDPDPSTEPDPEPEPEDPEPEPEPEDPEPEPEPEDPEPDPEPEPSDPEPDPANNPNPQPSDPDPEPDPNDDGSGGFDMGTTGPGGDDPTPEPPEDEGSPLDPDDDKFPFFP